jgi:signal transduction histidine kinase
MREMRYLKFNSFAAVLVWSGLLGGFLYYDVNLARQHTDELARKEARANFDKDQAFRLWATGHGGVYVPIDDKTPPNPALAHIPERDIQTPSGKKLTLMNPAYMLRQLMDQFGELYGIKGKITSFKLMNSANAPDAWEAEAMHQFEQGRKEVFEVTDIGGEPYLRLMGAMQVQQGCLKCHGFQGYKVGEVRGGVCVSVPMRPYFQGLEATIRQKLLIFAAIWLIGLIGILSWSLLAHRRVREKAVIDAHLQRQHEAIERANAELTHFANISAHHLMEPARRLLSYTQRLRGRLDSQIQDDDARLSLQYIEQGATRMRDLIRDIERYLAAGIARGPLQLIDPAIALTEAQRRLSKLIIDGNPRIEVQSLLPVYLDLPRLTDLFEVLLANALVHAKAEVPTRILISAQDRKSSVSMRIEDNGPGIAEEYRERVFGVFEQLRPNPLAGTGIGLAIARSIVQSGNGKIWIETSTLGGIAVVFDLPTGADTL